MKQWLRQSGLSKTQFHNCSKPLRECLPSLSGYKHETTSRKQSISDRLGQSPWIFVHSPFYKAVHTVHGVSPILNAAITRSSASASWIQYIFSPNLFTASLLLKKRQSTLNNGLSFLRQCFFEYGVTSSPYKTHDKASSALFSQSEKHTNARCRAPSRSPAASARSRRARDRSGR